MSTVYRAVRTEVDEILVLEIRIADGREQTVGPAARFSTPDGDPAALARAEDCVAFLNANAARWQPAR